MLDTGIERDNIHYNISEDEGYGFPIIGVLSPREPGKTTSIMLDRIYADFKKKGLPAVCLVNQAADVTEGYMGSFEETINEFKGYEIHTKYPRSPSPGGLTVIREKESDKPFVYIISMNTPLTRLKRMNLGKVSCLWYDECNVNVSIGEKWPDNLSTKWNELYTTLARKSYPDKLKFYMTGNFYTRYNPLFIYLGIDCNKLEIGKKIKHKKEVKVGDITLDFSTIIDCYQLKPELKEYILAHNPGYHFDDTYQKYFEGKAIADEGLPIEPNKPEGYKLQTVFRIENRYLYIWKYSTGDIFDMPKYWMEATDRSPQSRKRNVYVASLNNLVGNSIYAKPFKDLFTPIRYGIARGDTWFNSPEAFYMMQQIFTAI